MKQTPDTVLMIRPAAFGANPQTAASNAFQGGSALGPDAAHAQALAEFDAAVAALRAADVRVIVIDDTPDPPRPDAVFPNNWLSTHSDGTVVLYPMLAPSRRAEVRPEVMGTLTAHGFLVTRTLDLTPWAERGHFLEGTGSLVLDRVNRVAFACLSPRTDRVVIEAFCSELGYTPVVFHACDAQSVAIYHTNVMMWVGERVVGVCLESIPDPGERERVMAHIAEGGRRIIDLSMEQISAFAGNMLELRSADGQNITAMSAAAYGALTDPQRALIDRPVVADLPVIEACSGGSMRCMLAEVFLPRA